MSTPEIVKLYLVKAHHFRLLSFFLILLVSYGIYSIVNILRLILRWYLVIFSSLIRFILLSIALILASIRILWLVVVISIRILIRNSLISPDNPFPDSSTPELAIIKCIFRLIHILVVNNWIEILRIIICRSISTFSIAN